jgi:hypothetical protein
VGGARDHQERDSQLAKVVRESFFIVFNIIVKSSKVADGSCTDKCPRFHEMEEQSIQQRGMILRFFDCFRK